MTSGDDLLTPAQAAAIVGVSVDSIRRYANKGLLPSQRTPGNQRRFRRSDVMALTVEPTEATA